MRAVGPRASSRDLGLCQGVQERVCVSVSLLGVAVPLNHEHEGLQTTAAGRGGLPPWPPAVELCPWIIKVFNHGTDLVSPLDFWGRGGWGRAGRSPC